MSNKFEEVIKKEGVSEESDIKGKYGILAVHGGQLDEGTSEIAKYVHENSNEDATSLYVMSSDKGDPKEHRVTSNEIYHTQSEDLSEVVEHVRKEGGHFVSIHGHKGDKIYVGGQNEEESEKVAANIKYHLEKAGVEGYEVVSDLKKIPKRLNGHGEKNIANKAGENGGVQIELPMELRKGNNVGVVGDALKDYVNNDSQSEVEYENKDQQPEVKHEDAA